MPTISISSVSDFTDVTSAIGVDEDSNAVNDGTTAVQQLMLLDLCPFLLE